MGDLRILSFNDFYDAAILDDPKAKFRLLKGSLQRCERCRDAVLVEETETSGGKQFVEFYNLTKDKRQQTSADIYSEGAKNRKGHVFREISHRDLSEDEAQVLAYYEMR